MAGKYVFVPVWNVEQELTIFQQTKGAQYMSVWQFNKQENCKCVWLVSGLPVPDRTFGRWQKLVLWQKLYYVTEVFFLTETRKKFVSVMETLFLKEHFSLTKFLSDINLFLWHNHFFLYRKLVLAFVLRQIYPIFYFIHGFKGIFFVWKLWVSVILE